MGLRVIQAGHFSTVQDLGRPGFRDRGVPIGGAFDRTSARLANALLGNELGESVLEMTGFGGVFEAQADVGLAVAGAPFRVEVENGRGRVLECSMPSSFQLAKRTRLTVGGSRSGARCYLGVVDGWQSPLVLGSRSQEVRLVAGDLLSARPSAIATRHVSDFALAARDSLVLRFTVGPDLVPGLILDGRIYKVSADSNRLGVRFEGERIAMATDPSRLSAPVTPGALQLAGGLPIVLGVAGGTVGGYPHVAQLISSDLDRLAQVVPGQEVRIQMVSLEEARDITARDRKSSLQRLLQIQAACRDGRGN